MHLEHVWPQALGGADSPTLFQTRDVCQTCNNFAGQWADGAFLKSSFITHERAIAARHYLDPARPGILPLIYRGIDQEFPAQEGELCERWIGPAGEHIYHVHQADHDKWFGYAGGDFVRRKRRDVGRAYIDLTASHPYWLITGLQSFIAYLEPARLFLVTICEGLPDQLTRGLVPELQATPIEAAELDWIRNRPTGSKRPFRMPLRIDFSDRFLAKLALGLGHNIIGSAFHVSPYADELRKLLWRRDPSEGDEIQVLGTGYWQANQFAAVSKMIGLTGAWTILLQAFREGLSASVCTPSGRLMTMVITNDTSLLPRSTLERYHMGELYFAVSQRRMFIGPVELPKYLAHRAGSGVLPAIAELEALKVHESTLPPRHWEPAPQDIIRPTDRDDT
jgi:hypothetical protein